MISRCNITGLKITENKKWTKMKLKENYYVTFKLIGENILLTEPYGNSGDNGITLLLKKRNKFLQNMKLYDKKYIEIKDYSHINGKISRTGRRLFTDFLINEDKNGNMLGFIGFKVPILLKLIFNTGIKLYKHKFLIKIVNDYKEAITIANNLINNEVFINNNKKDKPENKIYFENEIKTHINDLIKYISTINWENKGIKITKKIDKNYLFKDIYDSLVIIKEDFDEILEDNKNTKNKLLLRNQYSKLRAEIWKLSGNTEDTEDIIIEKILKLVGSSIDASRACYNIFKNDDPQNGDLICIHEWCNHGIKPTKGSRVPSFLVKHFIGTDYIELTIDSALKFIPKNLRMLCKPLLKTLADSQNLKSIIILPYYLNNKLKGWFTIDICKDHKKNFEVTDDIKNILFDVVNIFTIISEKKNAENMLNLIRKELEEKVNERTNELNYVNKLLLQRDDILSEKNTILETSLDILSHDTKNLFFNIQILLNQLKDNSIKNMIKESVEELFELTMETASFMQSKKRITHISDLLSKIRITSERILLPSHERINIKYNDYQSLFIETSSLFKNAIINIVENGLKYTPKDKKIDIETYRQKEKIIINIKDNGPGIPDDEKEKITKKYYRMNKTENIKGSGRGLWITQNIINKENGKLFIKDNKKGGTIFSIEIPAFKINNLNEGLTKLSNWFDLPIENIESKAEAVKTMFLLQNNNNNNIYDLDSLIFTNLLKHLREENKERNFDKINKKLNDLKKKNPEGKKILIVDDSIYVHYYLANFLTDIGYRIVNYAKNGKDAVSYYKKYKPDLITLDNTMHIMSGLDASKEIFAFDKNAKIIFITALGDLKHFQEEIEISIPKKNFKILTKPIKKDELKKAVEYFIN